MSKTFLQYRGAWAKKLYPKGNKKRSTYATSGCGPCSVASIVYNKVGSITPLTVGNYISSFGGATAGGATYHASIDKALRHYGFESREIGTMREWLAVMADGKHWGVLLFRSGTKGGIKWTAGGHYIACTDIKIKNGLHYLYMRDSGQRGHIGWYCYEKQMQGLIKNCWVASLPSTGTDPTEPEHSEPVKPVQTNAERVAEFAKAYAYGTNTSKARYPHGTPKEAYRDALERAYPLRKRKNWSLPARVGASCDVFVGAVLRQSGVSKKFHRGLSEQWGDLKNTALFEDVTGVTSKTIKNGDIIIYEKNNGHGHICIHVNGKVLEASYGDFWPKTTDNLKARLSRSGKKKLKVYRAKGVHE